MSCSWSWSRRYCLGLITDNRPCLYLFAASSYTEVLLFMCRCSDATQAAVVVDVTKYQNITTAAECGRRKTTLPNTDPLTAI